MLFKNVDLEKYKIKMLFISVDIVTFKPKPVSLKEAKINQEVLRAFLVKQSHEQ